MPAATFNTVRGSGWQPLVRPDGTLVIAYEAETTIEHARAAAADGRSRRAGAVYVAWHDCRFRASCTSNDIVLASSRDGRTWSRTRRVPTAPATGAA